MSVKSVEIFGRKVDFVPNEKIITECISSSRGTLASIAFASAVGVGMRVMGGVSQV